MQQPCVDAVAGGFHRRVEDSERRVQQRVQHLVRQRVQQLCDTTYILCADVCASSAAFVRVVPWVSTLIAPCGRRGVEDAAFTTHNNTPSILRTAARTASCIYKIYSAAYTRASVCECARVQSLTNWYVGTNKITTKSMYTHATCVCTYQSLRKLRTEEI